MPTLIYTEQGTERRRVLPEGETLVGRAANCDLVLDDVSVSRWHARFIVSAGACRVTDVGSSNGTFVNGAAVTEAELHDEDEVHLGAFRLRVMDSIDQQLSLSEADTLLSSEATVLRPVGDLPKRVEGALDPYRLLGLLSEVAKAFVEVRPTEVAQRIVDLVFRAIPAERAFLLLGEGDADTLVPRVARRRDGSVIERATISRTVARTVIRDRVAMLASDVSADPRVREAESVIALGIRSFMCAPIWHEDRVSGLLYVDNPYTRRFTEADLELFVSLANYAAAAIEQARLSARLLEETRRRERFQRYHSPAVVERILQAGGDAPIAAHERDISVIFADIVGFTQLMERLAAHVVARMLNDFFARMTDAIFEQEGTLDKFIGDAVMAVFGAPLEQPDHALRAVQTARAMYRALDALNRSRPDCPLAMRLAVNSGAALVGDIGSAKRREHTVLGDVVNVASRLQASVAQPGQILITRATYDRIRDKIPARACGKVQLRGRSGATEVFEVNLSDRP